MNLLVFHYYRDASVVSIPVPVQLVYADFRTSRRTVKLADGSVMVVHASDLLTV